MFTIPKILGKRQIVSQQEPGEDLFSDFPAEMLQFLRRHENNNVVEKYDPNNPLHKKILEKHPQPNTGSRNPFAISPQKMKKTQEEEKIRHEPYLSPQKQKKQARMDSYLTSSSTPRPRERHSPAHLSPLPIGMTTQIQKSPPSALAPDSPGIQWENIPQSPLHWYSPPEESSKGGFGYSSIPRYSINPYLYSPNSGSPRGESAYFPGAADIGSPGIWQGANPDSLQESPSRRLSFGHLWDF